MVFLYQNCYTWGRLDTEKSHTLTLLKFLVINFSNCDHPEVAPCFVKQQKKETIWSFKPVFRHLTMVRSVSDLWSLGSKSSIWYATTRYTFLSFQALPLFKTTAALPANWEDLIISRQWIKLPGTKKKKSFKWTSLTHRAPESQKNGVLLLLYFYICCTVFI